MGFKKIERDFDIAGAKTAKEAIERTHKEDPYLKLQWQMMTKDERDDELANAGYGQDFDVRGQ